MGLSNPWVITGANPGDHLKNLDAIWLRLRKRAGLKDVRVHDCRHSYASRALALGDGIPVISKLLGHRRFATTARYAHLARDGERAAAAMLGDSIGKDIFAWEDGKAAQGWSRDGFRWTVIRAGRCCSITSASGRSCT